MLNITRWKQEIIYEDVGNIGISNEQQQVYLKMINEYKLDKKKFSKKK